MIRSSSKFALFLLLSLALPVAAETPGGTVSGVVQDGEHSPMMGAVVELFGPSALPLLTAFTDIYGRYQFSHLAPGRYSVRVLQAYFAPARRKNIRVDGTTRAVVNLTLTSLFSMSQWFPASARSAAEPADDWTWTLRSGIDTPILRWIQSQEGPASLGGLTQDKQNNLATQDGESRPRNANHPVDMHGSLTAGSQQFGEGGVWEEAFIRVAQGNSGEAILHLQTSTAGAAFFAAGVERDPAPGDAVRAVGTFRTLPIEYGSGLSRLQILQFRGGEQLALSDGLMAEFGAETEAVQAGQTVTAALPFMAVHLQQEGNEITYRLATSTDMQGLTDLGSEGDVPAMAMQNGNLRVTQALHQEVAVERKLAGMQLEAAYFYDHLVDPVLNGYGDISASEFASGNVLMDPVTGAFRSAGPNYGGGGFRVMATRQFKGNLWAALEYAEGPAIALPASDLLQGSTFTDALTGVATTRTQSVLFSMHGRVLGAGTAWNAGYRWQPEATITAVDPFDTGLNAPFLSVTLHQPIGSTDSSPDKLELEFAMENILAQGYRPIYVVAGQTLFFAQAPRLVTGGLAFSF
ncbi:MAG: carboxypeptidase-like regulatory domain-containing protein [Acidobacteriaceae bacterium]